MSTVQLLLYGSRALRKAMGDCDGIVTLKLPTVTST
jgi:hypothetical protein